MLDKISLLSVFFDDLMLWILWNYFFVCSFLCVPLNDPINWTNENWMFSMKTKIFEKNNFLMSITINVSFASFNFISFDAEEIVLSLMESHWNEKHLVPFQMQNAIQFHTEEVFLLLDEWPWNLFKRSSKSAMHRKLLALITCFWCTQSSVRRAFDLLHLN